MAITMMINQDQYDPQNPNHELSEYWSTQDSSNPNHRPIYLETTHHGLVIATGEMNGYDDSDFYAVVWDPETESTKRITYASTRGWTYPNHAEVDATPEVLAAVKARQKEARIRQAAHAVDTEAHMPEKGRTVIVTKGRTRGKSPVETGAVGTILYVGWDQFQSPSQGSSYYRGLRESYGIHSIDLDCRDHERVAKILLEDGRVVWLNWDRFDVIPEVDVEGEEPSTTDQAADDAFEAGILDFEDRAAEDLRQAAAAFIGEESYPGLLEIEEYANEESDGHTDGLQAMEDEEAAAAGEEPTAPEIERPCSQCGAFCFDESLWEWMGKCPGCSLEEVSANLSREFSGGFIDQDDADRTFCDPAYQVYIQEGLEAAARFVLAR